MPFVKMGRRCHPQTQCFGILISIQDHRTQELCRIGPKGIENQRSEKDAIFPEVRKLWRRLEWGVIQSHQLAEGDTPMLLSLHAQPALGIVKNMRTCEISIDGKLLEWFRCSRTGLLMLNFTQGLRDANQESLDDPVPNFQRKYRVLTGFTVDGPSPMLPGRKWQVDVQ